MDKLSICQKCQCQNWRWDWVKRIWRCLNCD